MPTAKYKNFPADDDDDFIELGKIFDGVDPLGKNFKVVKNGSDVVDIVPEVGYGDALKSGDLFVNKSNYNYGHRFDNVDQLKAFRQVGLSKTKSKVIEYLNGNRDNQRVYLSKKDYGVMRLNNDEILKSIDNQLVDAPKDPNYPNDPEPKLVKPTKSRADTNFQLKVGNNSFNNQDIFSILAQRLGHAVFMDKVADNSIVANKTLGRHLGPKDIGNTAYMTQGFTDDNTSDLKLLDIDGKGTGGYDRYQTLASGIPDNVYNPSADTVRAAHKLNQALLVKPPNTGVPQVDTKNIISDAGKNRPQIATHNVTNDDYLRHLYRLIYFDKTKGQLVGAVNKTDLGVVTGSYQNTGMNTVRGFGVSKSIPKGSKADHLKHFSDAATYHNNPTVDLSESFNYFNTLPNSPYKLDKVGDDVSIRNKNTGDLYVPPSGKGNNAAQQRIMIHQRAEALTALSQTPNPAPVTSQINSIPTSAVLGTGAPAPTPAPANRSRVVLRPKVDSAPTNRPRVVVRPKPAARLTFGFRNGRVVA